ncbi:MAG: SDR family NAD(P)-dependent oxidoreductase [Chitinophagaceae bacterium]|nr:SDR family NAD(P)-dependent oxidoreductase [Chitinophagaceae bacterium]
MQIKEKVFVVSGGVSGLGKAVVSMIIENSGKVIILDKDAQGGYTTKQTFGNAVFFMETDVANFENVEISIRKGYEYFGNIHGAITCAGLAPAEKIIKKEGFPDINTFNRTITTNLCGTFYVLTASLKYMKENSIGESGERGVLITTSSVAAFEGQIGQSAYAASKGGVISMTLPIAREIAKHKMRIMSIAPGIFDTPLMEKMNQDVRDSLTQQIPFPSRFGKPKEYADTVKYIIENQMLNGSVIRLDGAVRMNSK